MGRAESLVLGSLVVLDVVLAGAAYFFPELWFAVFHGAAYVDPQGLLRRCGGNWAAFALFQLIALLRYRERPRWLVLVAGLRLSDIFTDWGYLYFSESVTWFGRAALLVAPPVNLGLGLYLMKAHERLTRSGS